MKKGLYAIGALLVIIIGVGLFVKIKGVDLIKSAASTSGREMLGAKVSLDDISLGLLDGTASISGLSIGQPEGFGDDQSFTVETFYIKLEPMSLFGDHIKMDSILIDNPVLTLVLIGTDTNFTKLQTNLDLPADETEAGAVKMSIKQLHLNKTQLKIRSDKLGDKQVTLADVHLTNIGIDENGVAPSEVLRLSLDALRPQIAKALVKLGIKNKLSKELESQVGDKLKDITAPVADKLKKGIGDFLKKKKPKT
jgi:hypothetical protein